MSAALVSAAIGSAWNAGGAILTVYFPVGLFIVVALLLSLQFGRPHVIPGRKPLALARMASEGTVGSASGAPADSTDSTPAGDQGDARAGSGQGTPEAGG